MKIIVASLLAASVSLPALAQNTSYYIVRDATTKRCTITHEKPTGSSMTVVSGDTVYRTETEAQTAMKTTRYAPKTKRGHSGRLHRKLLLSESQHDQPNSSRKCGGGRSLRQY